jgi:hypothetical protein
MAAPKGNNYASEWTLENALPRFEDALNFTLDDEKNCLCLQEAIMYSGIPSSTFYYLSDNHKVLETIKKKMNDAIIIRVNRGAITGKYKETASIFRMKQLGERDKMEIDHTTAGESFNVKPFKFRRSE